MELIQACAEFSQPLSIDDSLAVRFPADQTTSLTGCMSIANVSRNFEVMM